MDIKNLKTQIESMLDDASVYLVEALNDIAGFFVNNGQLLYMVKDIYGYLNEGIETDYLRLQTHIRITSVKNNQTFKDDYYNIIIFKGNLDDINISSFVQLCSIHSNNLEKTNFREFFYSLISIFQLPSEQAFTNAVGLYGELKFMQYAKERRNIDVSNSWHRNGSYSQYDFSNGEECVEIKTTLSDDYQIAIKHEQIFGEHPCTLVAINCEQYENGETIEEVISAMYSENDAFKGMNFSINLAKELKRVSMNDIKTIRFAVKKILFFSAKEINPLPIIPETVCKLRYQLDISELPFLSEMDVDVIIDSF